MTFHVDKFCRVKVHRLSRKGVGPLLINQKISKKNDKKKKKSKNSKKFKQRRIFRFTMSRARNTRRYVLIT